MLHLRKFPHRCLIALSLLCPLAHGFAHQAHAASPAGSAQCFVPDQVAWNGQLHSDLAPQTRDVRIIVLGSSSTAGAGASNARNTFVARLADRLTGHTSLRHRFSVVNAGINGNTTADMLVRLRRDILPAKPGLVIWQTGVNDAIRGVPLDQFERDLARGLSELRQQSIPVVLIDQQDMAPDKFPNIDKYVTALEKIARQEAVTLLHRYRVMRYLANRRVGGIRSLLADDGLHMNDFSHRCIGELLAAGIGRIFG